MTPWLILLAGGRSLRMGGGTNKTLTPLMGVPAIARAAAAFVGHVHGIVFVARPEDADAVHRCMPDGLAVRHACAGEDRQASVLSGLSVLPPECDTVLIHDGARPLVTSQTAADVLRSVAAYGTGIAAAPAYDTFKRADASLRVTETLSREGLYAIMTPQGFSRVLIERAHAACGALRATDDAALVEALGEPVHLVMTSPDNIKLTRPEDISRAETILRTREGTQTMPVRVGHGFDAHRLAEGRKLVLCGIEIPYERGLLGHSDADVAAHALMDALLGAAALGDIGKHFPDKDDRYLGISSMVLLAETRDLLTANGYQPFQADVTIIAQKPKLAGYIGLMRTQLAQTMGVTVDCVSVKATTTEGMGFPGEGLGIAAHAVATVTPCAHR